MSAISFFVELKEAIVDVAKKIEKAFFALIKKRFGIDVVKINTKLLNNIKNVVRKNIEEHPTFISLLNGTLLFDLGLPLDRREWAAVGMINQIVDGLNIQIIPIELIVGFEFDLKVVWSNEKQQELINNGFAAYISVGKDKIKTQITWLDWLLEAGQEIVVSAHHIEYGSGLKGSRTGGALMKKGGSWHMLSQFAGTADDNFVTQSINKSIPEIQELIIASWSK